MLPPEIASGSSPTPLPGEIEQPILVSEIVGRDGSRSIHFRVFCARREASVSLDTCRVCPALREVAGEACGNGAWVRCSRETTDSTDAPAALRRHATDDRPFDGGPAGAALRAVVSAVRDDLSLKNLRSHFVEQLVSSVYVVDESNRLLGVVRDVDLLASRSMARSSEDPLAACASVMGSSERDTAAQIMGPTPWVREDTPVRHAVLDMARTNQRRTAVVTSDGALLGVLDDVSGLKWLVGRR